MWRAPRRTAEDVEDVRREVQIMHHLEGHANIVKIFGAYEDKHSVHLARPPPPQLTSTASTWRCPAPARVSLMRLRMRCGFGAFGSGKRNASMRVHEPGRLESGEE